MESVMIYVEVEVEVLYEDSEEFGFHTLAAYTQTKAPKAVAEWAEQEAMKRVQLKGV